MTAVQPLVFPGSRVLAGWSRQLAVRQPQALWVGHLLLHRVETLAEWVEPCPLEPLCWFVLRGVHLAGAAPVEALNEQVQLGPLLRQVLRSLESRSLVHTDAQECWSLTPGGRAALETSVYSRPSRGRRVFYFREPERSEEPPRWLDFRMPEAASAWHPDGKWRFDIELLQAYINRPQDWKERHGFPRELLRILSLSSAPVSTPAWQLVPLDRPEQIVAALVLTHPPEGKEQVLGFAARAEGWVLQTAEPAFALGDDWPETFPELAIEPDPGAWRDAWLSWCQPRGLPVAEIEACRLELDGMRISIQAPERLLERFRATRSDVLKGEAWLLAGSGRLRRAARAEIVA
jgi:hypothetical protein